MSRSVTRKQYMNTRLSQDVFTLQILNSYLKEYRRYAPDAMSIPETRSEVTVTQGCYATLCHPKTHAHTKFGIPFSNNTRYMPRTGLF